MGVTGPSILIHVKPHKLFKVSIYILMLKNIVPNDIKPKIVPNFKVFISANNTIRKIARPCIIWYLTPVLNELSDGAGSSSFNMCAPNAPKITAEKHSAIANSR